MSAASYSSPQVVGLDGVTRDWSETMTARPGDPLRLDNIVGHVVRHTFFEDGVAHEDFAQCETYGEALDISRKLLETIYTNGAPEYVVIDNLYDLGDRVVRSNG